MYACVEGCVNGPGNTHSPLVKYERIERVTDYINNNARKDPETPEQAPDFSRGFAVEKKDPFAGVPEEAIEEILRFTAAWQSWTCACPLCATAMRPSPI